MVVAVVAVYAVVGRNMGQSVQDKCFFLYIMSAYVEASAEIVFFKRDSNINICCYNYFWS